ncbi:hypothetical protein M5K25_008574 [Dendrobium thyrsiflorum]|uniref:Acid phosphatase 1 n=1 Tax=Dendrobium thyrsiflorum TaxID=117978 RepID=A0ABD0V8U4_DENTH
MCRFSWEAGPLFKENPAKLLWDASHPLHVKIPFHDKAVDTLLRLLPQEEELSSGDLGDDPNEAYCESWRLSMEMNNAGNWKKISARCSSLVEAYVRGPQYALDSKVVARFAQAYAKNIQIADDGMDAWIFDVDETLISNIHHYFLHGAHRWKVTNETAWEQWAASTKSPALPWSLWLYKKLQGMGFQLILLTGRKETHRNSTEQNILVVGYHSWEMLIQCGLDFFLVSHSINACKTLYLFCFNDRMLH